MKENTKEDSSLLINSAEIIKYLIIVAGVLIFMNLLVIIRTVFINPLDNSFSVMFFFDMENNLPSYFSTTILLVASFILAIISFLKRKQNDSFQLYWVGLALIFLLLSIDESLSLHNRVENLLDPLKPITAAYPFLLFSWVILGILFVGCFMAFYLRFFLALPKVMKIRFFGSGAIYVLGAIGFEMIGAYFFAKSEFNTRSLTYMLMVTIEESLEIAGVILFIDTLLKYLKLYATKYSISIK